MRVELSPREISLLGECIEKTVDPIKESDEHIDVVVELSIVYIRLLKALRDSLAADEVAFEAEYGHPRGR